MYDVRARLSDVSARGMTAMSIIVVMVAGLLTLCAFAGEAGARTVQSLSPGPFLVDPTTEAGCCRGTPVGLRWKIPFGGDLGHSGIAFGIDGYTNASSEYGFQFDLPAAHYMLSASTEAANVILKELLKGGNKKQKKAEIMMDMNMSVDLGLSPSDYGALSWPCDSCPSPIPPPPCPPMPCPDCVGSHYGNVNDGLEPRALNHFFAQQGQANWRGGQCENAAKAMKDESLVGIALEWSGYNAAMEESITTQNLHEICSGCAVEIGHAWQRELEIVGHDLSTCDDGIATGFASASGPDWVSGTPASTPNVSIPSPFYGIEPAQWWGHVYEGVDAQMPRIGPWRTGLYARTCFTTPDTNIVAAASEIWASLQPSTGSRW